MQIIACHKICKPKCEGKQGIRETYDVSATFSKRMLKNSYAPRQGLGRLVKAKYRSNNSDSFLTVKKSLSSSNAWKKYSW